MSTLTLVRHGQATAFAKNSDRLTTLGEQQAHRLGEAWAAEGRSFNRVLCGTLERQRRTAEIVCGYLPDAPPIEFDAALNEYDATGVTTYLADVLARRDSKFADLRAAFEMHKGEEDRNKHFQRMFERLMTAWLEDGVAAPEVESASTFFARVERVLTGIITSLEPNQRIAVFTSGGVIGRAVQWTTKAPTRTALDLNWRVRNCSVTEFLYSGGRISLDLFNSTAHLPQQMVTYR